MIRSDREIRQKLEKRNMYYTTRLVTNRAAINPTTLSMPGREADEASVGFAAGEEGAARVGRWRPVMPTPVFRPARGLIVSED